MKHHLPVALALQTSPVRIRVRKAIARDRVRMMYPRVFSVAVSSKLNREIDEYRERDKERIKDRDSIKVRINVRKAIARDRVRM